MRGIVAGKFCPPHRGHHLLIDTALTQCTEVDVLVVDNPSYPIPAARRAEWLRQVHPAAKVHVIADIGHDGDSVAWAAHATSFLRRVPDIVFSSEPYGITWAAAMGAQHVMVDQSRIQMPISATQVRTDLFSAWDYLADPVKAGLALRIVVAGAESTGTTTLARDLAEALRVDWVPEVGRYYTESILTSGAEWREEDFYRIGELQQHYEATLAMRSGGVLVCDTNSWATQLWQRRYLGHTTKEMELIAQRDRMDLLLITGDEIDFVQDGLRDGEHIRHEMHQWFVDAAKESGIPFTVLRGSREQRLAEALKLAHNTIEQGRQIG